MPKSIHLREPDSYDALCGGEGLRVGSPSMITRFLAKGNDDPTCKVCKAILERLESQLGKDKSGTSEKAPELPPSGPTVALKGGAQVFRA